jgi:hypothetical protein
LRAGMMTDTFGVCVPVGVDDAGIAGFMASNFVL